MRAKLTATLTGCAVLVAGSAVAAPIPVAQYTFDSKADVAAFQKASRGKCFKKLRQAPATGKKGTEGAKMGAMGVKLGAGANACVQRTSVVADSSDAPPDHAVSATVSLVGGAGPKLQKKAYLGATVRQNDTAGYELRVLPIARKWQVFRDPEGAAPASRLAGGKGKFIRGGTKPNNIALRAFSRGGPSTALIATVNGQNVVSTTDSADDQPDGRRNGVTVGAKGTGAGTGIIGAFDVVTVSVPNPF